MNPNHKEDSSMLFDISKPSYYLFLSVRLINEPTSLMNPPYFIQLSMLFLQRAIRYRYWQHNFQRKDFAVLEDTDLSFFRSFLPPHAVINDQAELEPHNLCFRKLDRGHSKLMLCPANTDHVSKILAHCNARRLAVVPQGGNTGLVGGSVPVFDEILLSLKNMNKIEGFNEVTSIVGCEAGVILDKLNQYLEPYGFETPLDLGAKGSCQIGGNASTNAGGKYVIKYGSFRSHILGLEAVMPNGDVLNLRSEIQKDNTGYDLKQLFIGGEGTIGVITKLNILCEKIDNIRKIMVFKTDKFEQILQSLPIIKRRLGKSLAALEYIDGPTYHTVVRHLHPGIFDKVQDNEHMLFVQASTEELDELFEEMKDFNDAIMSNNDKEYSKIWKIREDVAVAAVREKGRVLAYDISFDVREWPGLLNHLRNETKSLVLGYGHIGDGNLHVNIILEEGSQFQDSFVFKEVARHKGSISAEHGVGLHKPSYLSLQKSPQILQIYRNIKKLFDPNGIMNPYKVIPE